ncbi:MAG: hypothetical protein FE78DRAFT_67760, partial [Acidomyces sp. 'richmondensis']
ERLEQERLEQERLEQERLEQERLEQEKLEQERLEQERLEQERLERERLERERLKQERLEQERLEQERLEQERVEQERLEQEKLEQERLERARLEKGRLEQESIEQKEFAKAKKVKAGKDTADANGRVQLLEGLSRKQGFTSSSDDPRTRTTQINLDFVEALKDQTRNNQVVTNLQAAMPLHGERSSKPKVRINFLIRERGITRIADIIEVDPSDPSEVERVAFKYTRKEFSITNTNGRVLHPKTCFEDVTADGTNTILLISRGSTIDTDKLVTARTTKQRIT